MKRLILLLTLALLLPVHSFAGTATLTGTLRSASGNLFNGTIKFFLPFAGAVDTLCEGGGECLVEATVKSVPIINGIPTPACCLTRNGDIQPKGTYYRAYVYDTTGTMLSAHNFVIPAGVSVYDLGAALQTSITTNNVSFINPADLNGNNTWTGNQIFSGTVTFNSTVTGSGLVLPCPVTFAANTVCGNNTGGVAAPSPVKVTYSMTDTTTIAPLASPAFTGTPTAPTPTAGDSSTKVATTAFVQSLTAAGQIIGAASATSCTLAANNGEWNCTGTFSWGATLPTAAYKISCSLSTPPGGYAIPAGYQANFYWTTKTATNFTYAMDDDHSGSNGANYTVDCIAVR